VSLEVVGERDGFKVRTGAVLVREGRLLLHTNLRSEYWVTPGGGVAFGETARQSLVREMREELGAAAEVGKLLFLVEHFFETPRRRWHQLLFLHEVRLPDDCDAARRDAWEFDDGEGPVTFRWTPLDELSSIRLLPGFLGEALRGPPAPPRRVLHVDRVP
jgi:ADP-ribose pyrophosphatase YjhB (NUDIX family)